MSRLLPHLPAAFAAVLFCVLPAPRVAAAAPGTTTSTQTNILPPIRWGPENEWSLQIGGMHRLRYEYRGNHDMNKTVYDDDRLMPLRTQVSADIVYRKVARAFVEVLDSRMPGQRTDYQQEAHAHLNQAWVEFRQDRPNPWALRLGRQELTLGESVLVDTSRTWSNLPSIFQGARILRSAPQWDLTAFVLQPTTYRRPFRDTTTSGAKRGVDGQLFYGIYPTFRFLDPHEFDVYYLGFSDTDEARRIPAGPTSEDGTPGDTHRHTVGTRWRGPIRKTGQGTLGYGLEGGYQFGRNSTDRISAWFLHADINHQWDTAWRPKVALVANMGSGDRRPGDGETNTFIPLYGTTRNPYGLMDFVRLQNMRQVGVEASLKPTAKLTIEPGAHLFWLDSATDAWYNSGGSSLGRDKTGRSGRDLGSEVNMVAKYRLNNLASLEAGAVHFFSGGFAGRNGRGDSATSLYVQYVLRF